MDQKAIDRYQQFYDKWRKNPERPEFGDQFPHPLDLGVDTAGISLLHFHEDDRSGNQILITKAYDDMFHRLLGLRRRDTGRNKGAIITGQPGVGVSPRSDPHPVRQLISTSILQAKLPF